MIIILIILLIFNICNITLFECRASNIFSFLRIDSIAGDEIFFENPASCAKLSECRLLISHTNWIQEVKLNDILLGIPTDLVNIRLGLKYLSMPDIEKYGVKDGDIEEYLGHYKANAQVFLISLSKNITQNISLGSNLKLVREKIDQEIAKGMALDLSSLLEYKKYILEFGLYNLGMRAGFVNQKDTLPFYMQLGLGRHIREIFSPYLRLRVLNEGVIGLSFGTYVQMRDNIGLVANFDLQRGYNFFVKLGLGIKKGNLGGHYLLNPSKTLDTAHIFTFSYKFGKIIPIRPYLLRILVPMIPAEEVEERKEEKIQEEIPKEEEKKEEKVKVKEEVKEEKDEEKIQEEKIDEKDKKIKEEVEERVREKEEKEEKEEIKEIKEEREIEVLPEKEKIIEKEKVEKIIEDKEPPYLFIIAYPSILSASLGEGTSFIIVCRDNIGIESWRLIIIDKENNIVKEFRGEEEPPEKISWAGRDKEDNLLPQGSYMYIMEVEDLGGNITKSHPEYITIY